MNFINPPTETPKGVFHKTFYSKLVNHEIGYNIYLPPDYEESDKRYMVTYHLHGHQGNESSEIWELEKIYRNRQIIFVFPNATSNENGYLDNESIVIKELIPYIDGKYRTNPSREERMLSGFSMGGGSAFYYAIKYHELFSGVTAYAGTYHHYIKNYRGVGEKLEKANELYENILKEGKHLEKDGILCLIKQNMERIYGYTNIKIHIGTADPLVCENEILHLYLDSLNIPHEYKKFEGIDHELDKIIL